MGAVSSVGNLSQKIDRFTGSKSWAKYCDAHLSGLGLLTTTTCPLKLRMAAGNHPNLSYLKIEAHDGLQAYQNLFFLKMRS